jgi:NAD(P)-dependent dehydrogenase (short-subunit alcohol dehydrogenase family)
MRLRDKVAIVTGGANGIGQAICELFAEEGASVVVADIERDAGLQTVDRIEAGGGQAMMVEMDVSREADVEGMVRSVVSALGRVDVLVSDAAAFSFGSVDTASQSDWDRALGVNVMGTAYCAKHVLPVMKESGGGSIVVVASVSSFIAQPAFVPYNASKGALLQMTRCMALDMAPFNIRVNCVCPGSILTRATERHREFLGADREQFLRDAADASMMKRLGAPREIAYGALFLASDESSFMTGAPLVIDGGLTAQ